VGLPVHKLEALAQACGQVKYTAPALSRLTALTSPTCLACSLAPLRLCARIPSGGSGTPRMGRSRRARSSASQCSARPSAQRSPRLTQRRVRMPRDVGRLWSCLRAAAGSCCASIVRAAALALPGVVDVISAADVKALGCSNSLTGSGSALLHPRNVHVGCVRLDSHGRVATLSLALSQV